MVDPKWIFFHCIKKNRIEPYVCKSVTDIYSVKVPNIEANEYLIPLCAYIPRKWHQYYLAKYIRERVAVNISTCTSSAEDSAPVDLVI